MRRTRIPAVRHRTPLLAEDRCGVATQRGHHRRRVLGLRHEVVIARHEREQQLLAGQEGGAPVARVPDDRAPERLASQPLDEPRGVPQDVAREAAAARAAQRREHPAHGGHRVAVQRVEAGRVRRGHQQQPLHAVGVAHGVALGHVAAVTRTDDRHPLDAQLHPQRLDVLHRVARAVEGAPLAEQRRARRGLAPRIGGGRGLEVTAAESARSGSALVEADERAPGLVPGELIRRQHRFTGPVRERERHLTLPSAESGVALHPQRQPAGHGPAVVQGHGERPRSCASPQGRKRSFASALAGIAKPSPAAMSNSAGRPQVTEQLSGPLRR